MKKPYKTKRALRVYVTEVPMKLKLKDDAFKTLKFKDYFLKTWYLASANRLIELGRIKEPGIYDIVTGWTWKRPTKYWFEAYKVK